MDFDPLEKSLLEELLLVISLLAGLIAVLDWVVLVDEMSLDELLLLPEYLCMDNSIITAIMENTVTSIARWWCIHASLWADTTWLLGGPVC